MSTLRQNMQIEGWLTRHSRSKHSDKQETAASTNLVPMNMEIIERILSEIVTKLRH